MTSQRESKGACVSVLRKREHSLFTVKSSTAVNTDLKASASQGYGAVHEHFHSLCSLLWWWWMRFMLGLISWVYSIKSVLVRGRWPGVPLWSASGQAFLQHWWMRWWISGSAEVLWHKFLSKHADAVCLTLCFLRRCGAMGCIEEECPQLTGLVFPEVNRDLADTFIQNMEGLASDWCDRSLKNTSCRGLFVMDIWMVS